MSRWARGTGLAAVVVALALSLGGCATTEPVAHASTLDELLQRWQRRSGAHAVVVAVDPGDGRSWVRAAGPGRPDANGTIAADVPVRIASITKLFVATVVMQLVEEGRIGLDDRVEEFLPSARLPDVTVRHLLSHTSGLPDVASAPDVGDRLLTSRSDRWDPERVLELVAGVRPDFAPGTDRAYSNTGFVVLGQVVEAVTGRSWADEVRTRLIDPLGLEDTRVPSHGEPSVEVLAGFHDVDLDGVFEDVETGPWPALETFEGAAGAMVSTAADVARATRAMLSGEVLDEVTVATMAAPNRFDRRYDGYGLGVEWSRPDRVTLVVGHGGFLPGARSVGWYVPDLDTAIAVLANDSRVDPADLAELVLAHVLAADAR